MLARPIWKKLDLFLESFVWCSWQERMKSGEKNFCCKKLWVENMKWFIVEAHHTFGEDNTFGVYKIIKNVPLIQRKIYSKSWGWLDFIFPDNFLSDYFPCIESSIWKVKIQFKFEEGIERVALSQDGWMPVLRGNYWFCLFSFPYYHFALEIEMKLKKNSSFPLRVTKRLKLNRTSVWLVLKTETDKTI